MIRVGGVALGKSGDTEFCGLVYPDGDEISQHMAERLKAEPFYQSDKFDQAMEIVRGRQVAIDCGAWVGGWSRALSGQFRKVLSIEANPDNARCVSENCPGNVTVICAAVGDENGRASVAAEDDGPCVGTRVVSERDGVAIVPMRRLDDIAQVRALPTVDYIKVHVNGMELRALRGAANTISRFRPVLTVVLKPAIGAFGDTAEAAREFLTKDLRYHAAGGERPYEIWCP